MRVIAYLRVSTVEQGESGAGLEAQLAAINGEVTRRGWELVAVHRDVGVSGKSLARREGLASAIADLESGHADALIVSKLDRLSRSLLDFAGLMERSRVQGWSLVALDLGVDTSTPSGEMMANILATFAQFERRLIGQRTREALAVKRAQGIRLGRPPVLPQDVRDRIHSGRGTGKTLRAIAAELNADGIATAHGGQKWHVETIRRVLASQAVPPGQAAAETSALAVDRSLTI
jgi:DNA invertase Pin-like site-specific DNA recombinase